MKKTVYYYNINYICNNKCLFCFSYNVGNDKKEIEFSKIVEEIESSNPDVDDTVVINGGEPTLSSYFEQLLVYLSTLKSRIVVYTNGRKLKDVDIPNSNNIQFVIPIHGNEQLHDKITQVEGSYQNTVESLKYLQEKGFKYSIKFIINDGMIEENLNLEKILDNYGLHPKEIVLARLNITKKSKINNYAPPGYIKEKEYLKKWFERLRLRCDLLLLDFPPCYMKEHIMTKIDLQKTNDIRFVFSDYLHNLDERVYLKERLQFEECYDCIYCSICDLMSKSYYLLKYDKNEKAIILAME